ncbi:MAG: hypothetical protein KY463_00260, partial [Actinobacteria bacterium]|nr:hypothetical protein [Actinomycetota bacterium]
MPAREVPALARRVLVTLGGGRAEETLITVLDGLAHVTVDGLEVMAIGAAAATERMAEAAGRMQGRATLIERTDRMSELMAWADLAISAAGSTAWEL